ncbi:hypothetical protein B0T11DRAFT_277715 [Plectosphaerella cucumerina]|uniref:Uncharacterized protein n=1 Tax=Plectosphaerella cucumerina TaxID=40658 RepID=A0A8K0X6F3_9PEZI|nr:hypothetical protein B0T11DRAFT_277715 [Plectosphaerella cucumerina]
MSMPGSFSPKAAAADTKDSKGPLPGPSPSVRLGEGSDAFSLHSTAAAGDRFYDEDPAELQADDLPPLYTDDPDGAISAANPLAPAPGSFTNDGLVAPFRHEVDGREYFIDRRLDTDPSFLQRHIEALAISPPRPFVHLRGTHSETVRRDGKTEKKTHVDFDVKLELTPFLYSNVTTRESWREVRTADPFAKVRRGTVFPTRAPGFGGASGGAIEAGKPALEEWCHRYCASHAGLKSFMLRREVVGFNEELVRQKLENLVRATNYRGRVAVTFPVLDETVEVYNDARTNRWRLLPWVRWLFVFTLLFVFSWPWLFFRTARFEVVEAEWAFSRFVEGAGAARREYVSVSEEHWYNMWARAIRRAVLERRQGTLDQGDLLAAEGAQGQAFDAQQQQQGGAMGGFVRAGVTAMNAVNQHFGWGGDC